MVFGLQDKYMSIIMDLTRDPHKLIDYGLSFILYLYCVSYSLSGVSVLGHRSLSAAGVIIMMSFLLLFSQRSSLSTSSCVWYPNSFSSCCHSSVTAA